MKEKLARIRRSKLIYLLFLLIALLIPLFARSNFQLMVLGMGSIAGLTVLGMVVLIGYTGLLSLGNVAFFSIGAYIMAITTTRLYINPWFGLFFSAIGAALCGALVGIPSFKLRGPFLVIITVGFAEIIRLLSINLVELTGGPFGISLIPHLQFFGISLSRPFNFYYFVIVVLALVVFAIYRIRDSRIGRAMVSVKNDEIAAEILGINVKRIKLLSFTISALLAGFAGGLFAAFIGYIVSDMFTPRESSLYLVMTVMGGFTPVFSAISAIVITMLPEMLRFLQAYYLLIFSVILLVSILLVSWRQHREENSD